MTNKLVVIINSLKVPKTEKILLYEMEFLVPNYSCLQNPWLGGYRPQIPVLSVLCPQLNLLNPPSPQKKIMGTPLGAYMKFEFLTALLSQAVGLSEHSPCGYHSSCISVLALASLPWLPVANVGSSVLAWRHNVRTATVLSCTLCRERLTGHCPNMRHERLCQ